MLIKYRVLRINTVKLGVTDDVLTFNDGDVAKSQVSKKFGYTIKGLQKPGQKIFKSKKSVLEITKMVRKETAQEQRENKKSRQITQTMDQAPFKSTAFLLFIRWTWFNKNTKFLMQAQPIFNPGRWNLLTLVYIVDQIEYVELQLFLFYNLKH